MATATWSQTKDCFYAPTDTCNSAECDTYGVGPGPQTTGWAYREYTIPANYALDSLMASFNRTNSDIFKAFYCDGCSSFDFANSVVVSGSAFNYYDIWIDVTAEGIEGSGLLRVFAPTKADPVYWDSLCFATSITNVGVQELNKDGEVLIYPNPATDEVIFQSETTGHYQIFNLMGKLVGSGYKEQETVVIDISQYLSGVYYVLDSEGYTFKFIKK